MSTTLSFDKSAWLEVKHALFGKELVGCYYCGKIISKRNVGGVEGIKGKLTIFCDNLSCLIKASKVSKRFKK